MHPPTTRSGRKTAVFRTGLQQPALLPLQEAVPHPTGARGRAVPAVHPGPGVQEAGWQLRRTLSTRRAVAGAGAGGGGPWRGGRVTGAWFERIPNSPRPTTSWHSPLPPRLLGPCPPACHALHLDSRACSSAAFKVGLKARGLARFQACYSATCGLAPAVAQGLRHGWQHLCALRY